MTSSLSFPLATDTSIDELDKTLRGVGLTLQASGNQSNLEQLMTIVHTQQSMQFAMTEVDLALKRRNGFTTRLVSEIR